MGGKVNKCLVFPFLHSKTFLGFICSFVLGSPHSTLSLFLGPIFWPLFIPCSGLSTYFPSQVYLPISLLRHFGPQLQGKRGNDCSGFFRLYRGVIGLWVPFACRVYLGRKVGSHGTVWQLVLMSSEYPLAGYFL